MYTIKVCKKEYTMEGHNSGLAWVRQSSNFLGTLGKTSIPIEEGASSSQTGQTTLGWYLTSIV